LVLPRISCYEIQFYIKPTDIQIDRFPVAGSALCS